MTALKEADALAAQKRYYPAIDAYQAIFDIPVSETSIHKSAKAGIESVERAIQEDRDPLLVEARQLEQSNEESKAFKLYERATQVDPKHPEGYAGMDRIRGLLHERAKAIYTEAVLAESYSDLATAKRKYQEVMEVVPSDDIYYDRAKRKLIPYVRNAVPDEAQ
jgi:tetratricopeptide (TPR) repeat protein